MAFIKRDNQDNINKNLEESKQNIDDSTKFRHNPEEIKNYREDAIRTLNILEEKGINIYDESRYGGMYLRQNQTNERKLDKIFNTNSEKEETKQENIDFNKIFG